MISESSRASLAALELLEHRSTRFVVRIEFQGALVVLYGEFSLPVGGVRLTQAVIDVLGRGIVGDVDDKALNRLICLVTLSEEIISDAVHGCLRRENLNAQSLGQFRKMLRKVQRPPIVGVLKRVSLE